MTRPGRLVLLGHPVSHSLSPRFQQAALDAAGIAVRYEALDVHPDALDAVLRELTSDGVAGNVTIPHKEGVFAKCATRSAIAERVGAVNTFLVEDGALVGDNTDVGGFDAAAREAFGAPKPGMRVAVLGAGGGAAAVLAAIEQWPGARVALTSRTMHRAEALASRFSRTTTVASADEAIAGCDLVVNATSIGLTGDAMPVHPDTLSPTTAVFDLVYRLGGTPWVRAARNRQLAAADGLGMLIEQGALAFERWFGIAPDRRVMWNAVSAGR